MAEITTPRVIVAAKEFNIGRDTLLDFLKSKGFETDDLRMNSRISEEMYVSLQEEFQPDKLAKKKAQAIDLPKVAPTEPRKHKDEKNISPIKKVIEEKEIEAEKEEVAQAESEVVEQTEPPVEEPVIEETTPEEVIDEPETVAPEAQKEEPAQPEEPKEETVEKQEEVQPEAEQEEEPAEPEPTVGLVGPKVVAKIDLDKIDFSTRPKKQKGGKKSKGKDVAAKKHEGKPVAKPQQPAAKREEKPEKPQEKKTIVTVGSLTNAPEKVEPQMIKIETRKLAGIKVVDKIELPKEEEKKKPADKKRARKRIKVTRRVAGKGSHSDSGRGFKDRRNKNQSEEVKEIDEKEIQDRIKATQAKLAGGSAKGKSKRAKYRKRRIQEAEERDLESENIDKKLQVTEYISVSEFANLMGVSFTDVISKCMSLGIMVSINQRLEADVIELVAGEFGFEVDFLDLDDSPEMQDVLEEDDPEDLVSRPPIVTIMGHVDHGKTSLLDYIRHANVIAGEAGGITQHIGAYEVKLKNDRSITFLDTPGHEAFTAMRARGAKITDIAVIVIAADDAVMPQTKEAISHAQAADVPMVFAINKIDKDGANPDKIKEQLSVMNILVEDWGGKYQCQEISAKKGLNIDELLEKVLLEADLQELKANPDRPANGTVIEASLDKGRGYVATMLVQNGTLNQGDVVVSGQNFGRVKAMFNERNQRVETAGPSTPVLILGLDGAPQAGESFVVYSDESEAKEIAQKRARILREQGIRAQKHITLDEIGRRLALGNFKELNLILRGDVDGSVEALSDSLQELATEEIAVNVVHKGVGQITETDVMLATASDAIIIGFNVRPAIQASRVAEAEGVEIKTYTVIYDAIDEVKSAMEGMLEPKVQEKVVGIAEIRETYKFDNTPVAGCMVIEGKMIRNNAVRLVRDGVIVHTGELGSLRRYKDDVKEVPTNMECGLTIKNYNDIKVGDLVESFVEVEIKRTL